MTGSLISANLAKSERFLGVAVPKCTHAQQCNCPTDFLGETSHRCSHVSAFAMWQNTSVIYSGTEDVLSLLLVPAPAVANVSLNPCAL